MTNELVASMPFAEQLGVEIVRAEKTIVEGRLRVRDDLCTLGNTLHGGAVMALADSMAAVAAFLNLPEGASGTTTIESKTNFLRPAAAGTTVIAKTTPIKVGSRLSVWTTTILTEQGKAVAVVTQTQLVL